MSRLAYYNEIDSAPTKPWLVYVVTHEASGRRYVGISCNPFRRWGEHLRFAASGAKTALAAAIRKYGADAFSRDVIACARDWADACKAERVLIRQIGTKAPGGFNLTDGGEGCGGLSDEIRERIAARNRGRKMDADVVARRALAQAGGKRSDAMKAAVSAARKGKPLSPEHCAKLSVAKTGRKRPPRTAEHAAKISEGLRAAWARRRSGEVVQ